MPKQFIRNDGNVIIAEDFQTTDGVKLSETAASEGNIADGSVTAPKLATGAVATNLGFTPEDTSNKSTDGTLASNSDTLFPSEKAVKTYVDAHGGGSPAWGSVGGTLSDQTDLQSALDGKQSNLSGIHDKHHKAIANNADNGIFTFPLADGESETIQFFFNIIAKKGADWAIVGGNETMVIYNNGGSLVVGTGSNDSYDHIESGALVLSNINITATLSAGIVTAKINPGNVDSDLDSLDLDCVLHNPVGRVLTFL